MVMIMPDKILTRRDIENVITVTKDLYLADSIPWVIGYSGGMDSTATVLLVWSALSQLPKEQLKKRVYVISTDTLVESPVVAAWLAQSLARMRQTAEKRAAMRTLHR